MISDILKEYKLPADFFTYIDKRLVGSYIKDIESKQRREPSVHMITASFPKYKPIDSFEHLQGKLFHYYTLTIDKKNFINHIRRKKLEKIWAQEKSYH